MTRVVQVLARIGWFGYSASAGFVWLGFALARSRNPWLIGYSTSHLVFLVVLAAFVAVPWVIVWLTRRIGWRRLIREGTPALGLIALIYVGASTYYYLTQEHRFDPYLQNPATTIDDIARPRAPGEIRVAALGGSTTESPGLAEGKRYPTPLQALLSEAHPDRRVEVFNGGRNWWTTKHSLIHYVTHVRRWRPDVVVVMHAVNVDLYRSFVPYGYALGQYDVSWGHFYGPSIRGARPPWFPGYLLGRTGRLIYLRWYSDWRIREVDHGLDRYRSLPEYEGHLRTLAQLVAADGATLVVLTQGSLYKEEPSAEELAVIRFGEEFCMTRTGWLTAEYPGVMSLRRAMNAYNGVARRVAREEGADNEIVFALADPPDIGRTKQVGKRDSSRILCTYSDGVRTNPVRVIAEDDQQLGRGVGAHDLLGDFRAG